MYSSILWILIFVVVVGGWATFEIVVQRRTKNRSATGTRLDRGSTVFSLIIGLGGTALSFLFPILLPGANISWQPGTFLIGLVVTILGIALRWAAIRTLGPYFTGVVIIQESHTLVQHGIYKRIRHPSYSGALLLAIGIGVMIGNWISLLLTVLGLFVSLLRRIPVEEQALLQKIPGYADYMQRTKRLIPFVF